MKLRVWLCGTVVCLFQLFIIVNSLIDITNVHYGTHDKKFADYEYCYIRAVNRTYKYLSAKVKLYQIPVDNVTIRVDLRKKANGYKPFLYNVSIDGCKFMRTKGNPLTRYLYSFIENHTNMNHSCPYNHDIILEKMSVSFLNTQATKILPFPEGQYGIYSTWSVFGIPRIYFNYFVTIK